MEKLNRNSLSPIVKDLMRKTNNNGFTIYRANVYRIIHHIGKMSVDFKEADIVICDMEAIVAKNNSKIADVTSIICNIDTLVFTDEFGRKWYQKLI